MHQKLQSLLNADATYKSYVRKDMARVSLKLSDGTTYEASARTLEAANDRLFEKLDGKQENVKRLRREKDRERNRMFEDIDPAYDR